MKSEILSQIRGKFGSDILETNSDEVRVQCPYCKENGKTYDDYKLYINTTSGKYWCHRCHSAGVISSRGISSYSLSDIYQTVSKLIDKSDSTLFELPKQLAVEVPSSYSYLLNRGISEEDIYYYSIRVSPLLDSSRLSGRVVIPNEVINFDFTDMYSARSYIGSPTRYLNSYGSHANSIVFNLHRVKDNTNRIIINEGPINSIIAGHDSVALYGKYVSNKKITNILNKYPKEIIISLDKDAIDESYKLANRIKNINSNILVKIVDLPLGEDASSLGKDKYQEYVDRALEYKSKLNYWIEKYIR